MTTTATATALASAAAIAPPPPCFPSQTWAGELACFLPKPTTPLAVAGAVPRAGRGSWLKAAGAARLRIVPVVAGAGAGAGAASAAAAALELSLAKRPPVVRRDLSEARGPAARGAVSLLEDPGILLLPQGPAVFAFKFFDRDEAASFGRAVAALAEAAEAAAQAAAAADADATAAADAAIARDGPPSAAAAPLLEADAGGVSGGAPTTSAPAAAADDDADDEAARAAIRRLLRDPEFSAYVSRVEALWDEVAAAEGEHG